MLKCASLLCSAFRADIGAIEDLYIDTRRASADRRGRAQADRRGRVPCGGPREAPGETVASTEKPTSRLPWILILAAVVVAIVLAIALANGSKFRTGDDGGTDGQAAASAEPKTRYVPVSQKIATGQITVRAGGYVPYRITITPEMVDPTVTGSFTASGGSGNDIAAIVANEMNYTNWINGHEAQQVLWGTQGQQTTGKIEAGSSPASTTSSSATNSRCSQTSRCFSKLT